VRRIGVPRDRLACELDAYASALEGGGPYGWVTTAYDGTDGPRRAASRVGPGGWAFAVAPRHGMPEWALTP